MQTIAMFLAALLTIYGTSRLLGQRKDLWFYRRQGQRPTADATWRDHFQFGPPRTRAGWAVLLLLFLALFGQAWAILVLFPDP